MRVICIDEGTSTYDAYTGKPTNGPHPVKGNTYNVVKSEVYDDGIYYELAEFPTTPYACYHFWSGLFAEPVDEIEQVNQKEEWI